MAILIEIAITPFFLFDFVYRLMTAPTRWGYVIRRYGWADLIAVVPLLRPFRLARVWSVIRKGGRSAWSGSPTTCTSAARPRPSC